jgi:hypothetical protein
VSISGLTSVEKMTGLDGAGDGAAAVIAAVKPCAFCAPLRGFGA